jgi:hypothetical protein
MALEYGRPGAAKNTGGGAMQDEAERGHGVLS